MIEEQVFHREFTLLLDRFSRSMGTESILRYAEYLDAQLTTAAFVKACRLIFENDQFFPSPRRFVDVIEGSLKMRAAEEWLQVLHMAADHQRADLNSLSEAAQSALAAAGGLHTIARAEGDFRLGQLERQFKASYEHAKVSAGAWRLNAPEKAEAPVLEALL